MFECPGDEWSAFWVFSYGAVFSSVDDFAHVEVSDGCSSDRSAVFDFLAHAFLDFVAEVFGVELGDAAHDAVYEYS